MSNGVTEIERSWRRAWIISALGAVVIGLAPWLAAPRIATAAPTGSSFSCRASAARVAIIGLPVLEPFVANSPDGPCAPDSNDVLTPSAIGPLDVNAVNVATDQKPATLGSADLVDGDNATASSTVTNPTLTLGTLVVHADVLTATAGYTCQSGIPVASSSGEVVGLTVNGQSMTIPAGTNQTVSLGPLGTLVLNQVDTTQPGVITRRAVSLTTPFGTVVISEATADITGNPCAETPPPAPTPAPPPPAAPPAPPAPVVQNIVVQEPGTATLLILPPATARLIAAHACVRGSFLARIVGRRIERVVFSLDGRTLATRTHPLFQTSGPASPGRHVLVASVTFVPASGTSPRTFVVSFTGCVPTPPAFTG
jgi:hypothetical protein